MTGRLFLHIGPPKTATTSLQVAVEKLAHPQFIYGGVFQPRSRNAGSLAQSLHIGINGDDTALADCIEQLKNIIGSGKILLLSEEMLSLEQNGISTNDKIERLGKALANIPTTIIITIRDPSDGIISLYQELYKGLNLSHKLSFESFSNSSITRCYDYHSMDSCLKRNGFSDIKWIDFSLISENSIDTRQIFGDFDLWDGKKLDFPELNVGRKSSDGTKRDIDAVTMRAIGRTPLIRALIDKSGLRGTKITRFFSEKLDSISLRKKGKRTLNVPKDRADQLRAGYEFFSKSAKASPDIKDI